MWELFSGEKDGTGLKFLLVIRKKLMEGYMNVHFHPIPFFALLNRDFTGFFSHNFLESNRKALLSNNKQPAKL